MEAEIQTAIGLSGTKMEAGAETEIGHNEVIRSRGWPGPNFGVIRPEIPARILTGPAMEMEVKIEAGVAKTFQPLEAENTTFKFSALT